MPRKQTLLSVPPDVDAKILDDYCQRRHPGPTKDNMLISWKHSMDHAWNQKVIQMLAAEFRENFKASENQLLDNLPEDQEDDFVFNAIKQKLNRKRSMLQKVIRKKNKFSNLTSEELDKLMEEEENTTLVHRRRCERKRNVRILLTLPCISMTGC